MYGTSLIIEYDAHKQFKQLRKLSRTYNYLYILWFAHKPFVMAGCVTYAEAVLSSHDFLKKSSVYIFLEQWMGTGLLTSTGNKCTSRRRAITPTFHFAILNKFICIFEEQSKRLVENLKVKVNTGEVIDVQTPISLAFFFFFFSFYIRCNL